MIFDNFCDFRQMLDPARHSYFNNQFRNPEVNMPAFHIGQSDRQQTEAGGRGLEDSQAREGGAAANDTLAGFWRQGLSGGQYQFFR